MLRKNGCSVLRGSIKDPVILERGAKKATV
jgi:hypothetical protein